MGKSSKIIPLNGGNSSKPCLITRWCTRSIVIYMFIFCVPIIKGIWSSDLNCLGDGIVWKMGNHMMKTPWLKTQTILVWVNSPRGKKDLEIHEHQSTSMTNISLLRSVKVGLENQWTSRGLEPHFPHETTTWG